MTEAPVLRVMDLVKTFPTGRGVVHAVSNVSLQIRRGESLGLVGESGSGKTTVGRCILGLIRPDRGRIFFGGKDLGTIGPAAFRRLRSRIQIIFQDPADALNPRMSVGDAIAEPLKLTLGMGTGERRDRVAELLRQVGLEPRIVGLFPHQISTGVQQRVGIARAIATKPEFLVLDEPTSALDVSIRADILNLLRDLQAELGMSYLFVSHDLTAVRRLCQRVAIMYLGKVVETGATETLFNHPLHPYSRALLSSVLYPDPHQTRSRFLLAGEIPSAIDLPSGCPLHTRCPMATDECWRIVPPFEEKAPGHSLSCLHVSRRTELAGGLAERLTP